MWAVLQADGQRIRELERALRARTLELEAADRHITKLEEKVLKLRRYRDEIRKLKEQKQALRRSPERRVGQVLLAPYRLPQKLFREIRKRYWPSSYKKAPASEYQQWLQRHQPGADELARMRTESRGFSYQPLVSIVMPAFNTPAPLLETAVKSVIAQAYEKWELILVDDGSTDVDLIHLLDDLPRRDSRILTSKLGTNKGISAASNHALSLASGEWIALFDHDDLLEPDALFRNVRWLQEHPDVDLIYSDEDKLTEHGFDFPLLKPDWSPDLFLSFNYLCHFIFLRRELAQKVGGFRSEFDGSQDYDLLLRIIERTSRIAHVPHVLYHWRRSESSVADNIRRKPGALEAGRRAIEEHLRRTNQSGRVTIDWRTHAYWVRRELADPLKISIIIPVRDRIGLLARCIDSIIAKTDYPNYQIVIIDNESQTDEARALFSRLQHRVLHYAGPFNYSAINNFAVKETQSPWLLFLNSDIEVIDPEWLTIMAEHVQRPEVGAVGAQLLYPDDTIQHAGVILSRPAVADHAFRGFSADALGFNRQLQVTRNCSAITAACMLTRRDVFEQVGGFDEEHLPVTYSDIDLCLKMRRAGYLIVYTPFAKLYHRESGTRRRTIEPPEAEVIRQRWIDVIERDPYYNPNLSRERADFSLSR